MSALLDRPAADRTDGRPAPPPDWWPDGLPNPFALTPAEAAAALTDGARMSPRVFHLLYDRTPHGFRAELIERRVYVASPSAGGHAGPHLDYGTALGLYRWSTPGVAGGIDQTTRLADSGEVQPDLFLRIRLDHGGRVGTWNLVDGEQVPAGDDGDYLDAGPELVLEVSRSSLARDRGSKRRDYVRGGVREYVIADVRGRQLIRYDFAANPEEPTPPPPDGVLKSRAMPGLWLNGPALFAGDLAAVRKTCEAGLASPEHAAFAAKLAAAAPARTAADSR